MAKSKPLILYPNPLLKTVSKPVEVFDSELETLVQDLFLTMKNHDGLGLAAIQIGVPKRILVLDVSPERQQPQVFINPEILNFSKEKSLKSEGCLSFPGIYTKVNRADRVTVEYADLTGTRQVCHADGLLAHCLQHEIDHLNGITFDVRLSPLRKIQIKKKLQSLSETT